MSLREIQYEDDASILFDPPDEPYEATTGIWDKIGPVFEPVRLVLLQ